MPPAPWGWDCRILASHEYPLSVAQKDNIEKINVRACSFRVRPSKVKPILMKPKAYLSFSSWHTRDNSYSFTTSTLMASMLIPLSWLDILLACLFFSKNWEQALSLSYISCLSSGNMVELTLASLASVFLHHSTSPFRESFSLFASSILRSSWRAYLLYSLRS